MGRNKLGNGQVLWYFHPYTLQTVANKRHQKNHYTKPVLCPRALTKRTVPSIVWWLALPGFLLGCFILRHGKTFNYLSRPSQVTLHHLERQHCSSTTVEVIHMFKQNVSVASVIGQAWQLIDHTPSKQQEFFRGSIRLSRADSEQDSDIEVRAVVRSTDQEGLDAVSVDLEASGLSLNFTGIEDHDRCTEIKVTISLRTSPKKYLDALEIRSELLDINVDERLNWEVNTFAIHTSHGNSDFEGSFHGHLEPLITHNLSISSITGAIFGRHVCDGRLVVKNEHGSTYLFLGPRYTGRYEPKSISVSSLSGDIDVVGVFEYWPYQPLNHTIDLHSDSGRIFGQLPHGSVTNITSKTGRIKAVILPFGTAQPEDPSEVYTSSTYGRTSVRLLDAPLDSVKGHYNPLLNTISSHKVGEGKLELRYGYSWYGSMEARVHKGSIAFDSSVLDQFERGDGFVKAKRVRGTPGKSRMDATVGVGEMDIMLGL